MQTANRMNIFARSYYALSKAWKAVRLYLVIAVLAAYYWPK